MTTLITSGLTLYLSSKDSVSAGLNNTSDNFQVQFPTFLSFKDSFQISLEEFHCKLTTGFQYSDYLEVYCDVIEPQPTCCNVTDLLRRIMIEKAAIRNESVVLNTSRYVPLKSGDIRSINFRIKCHSEKGKLNKDFPVFLVLHIRPSY